MDNITKILQNLGLTSQETRTYLALLEIQESPTGKLCEKTNIASSNIYKILSSLQEKGLVSYRMQNNTKIFMPSPPETLNELFLEKEKDLEKQRKEIQDLIQNLKRTPIEQEPQSKYKYYKSFSGIKGMWHEINSLLNEKSIERIYGAKKESIERLLGFYEEHHKIRNNLNAKAKILIPYDMKPLGKKRKNKNTEVKFASINNEAEWGIVDDMVYIQHIITKEPRAFLIKDKVFAETFKDVFDKVWKTANS